MQTNIRLCTLSPWIIAALAVGVTPPSNGGEPEPASNAQLVQLVDELGNDDFQTRQQAAERLAELATDAERRDGLARLVQAALERVDTPYEARRQLQQLAPLLPQVKAETPADVSDVELDQLIGMLDGDTYGERIGAAARLASLVERPAFACRIVERLRPLRRGPTLSRQTRQRLEPIWDKAQLTWLSSDPRTWRFSPVAQEQIDQMLHLLVRPLPPPAAAESLQETRARLERKRRLSQREAAQGDLLALLVRDDQTSRVKAAVDERLAAGQIDDDARQRLGDLAEWMRTWLAVELWTERKVTSILELPVGVPYESPMAPRPTLFDRCDGRVAHCTSDAVLGPRDYPVGVLFPHPSFLRSDSQFVIFDLPTPRSRLAYHYRIKTKRDERLPELSERTLARLAAEKRPMKQAELLMLPSLDAHAVSRFAAKYLPAVGDPLPPDKLQEEQAGRGSPYENLCNMLVEIGTHEAVPGILNAIKSGSLAKPTAKPGKPQGDWRWVAALAILASDPGPDADRILPDLIGLTDPLVLNGESACDVGATAAAILVDSHHVTLEKFGLEQADDPLLAEFGGIGYRFNPPEMRRKVQEWWRQQKQAQK
ncbi:MAG TPA: hypothetical protein VG125_26760 [Pirellulales bacterium]|jgi:hypothetical protein|nr:hypothetical protein [Pirellulales bacterium]